MYICRSKIYFKKFQTRGKDFKHRFADDQAIFAETESKFQRAIQLLYNIPQKYSLEMAIQKPKVVWPSKVHVTQDLRL